LINRNLRVAVFLWLRPGPNPATTNNSEEILKIPSLWLLAKSWRVLTFSAQAGALAKSKGVNQAL
jgi:hypothetical protein